MHGWLSTRVLGGLVTLVLALSPLGTQGTAAQEAAPPGEGLSAIESHGVYAVAAGGRHTCAISQSGALWCWGSNTYGQLGDGSGEDSDVPVRVDHGPFAAVTAGAFHTCAVRINGRLFCWGRNDDGQLGDGSNTDRLLPVPVSPLNPHVQAVAAGMYHTCAIGRNARVWCWGRNDLGQLGNGTQVDSNVPVRVGGNLGMASRVSAGEGHSCAIGRRGQVFCWGDNTFGQIGDNTQDRRLIPVRVARMGQNNIDLSIAVFFSCAVNANARARCWGSNAYGQLGNGTNLTSARPRNVRMPQGARAIAAGGYTWQAGHACALDAQGRARCWGYNGFGQLGDGTDVPVSQRPVFVQGLGRNVEAIAASAGGAHVCAIRRNGRLACWGWNGDGQLGDGSQTSSNLPVAVQGDLHQN